MLSRLGLASSLAFALSAPASAQVAYALLGGSQPYSAGAIVKTTDGGQDWTLLPGFTENEVLYSIHFTSPTNGFAVGTNRTIVKTTDGGATWPRLNPPAGYPTLRRVHFLDANLGAVADGFGGVLWTTDGGQNWDARHIGVNLAAGFVHVLSPQVAYLGTDVNSGLVYKTTDGGATWAVDPAFEPAKYRFCRFVDANEGYIYGSYSGSGTVSFRLYKTVDGGVNWSDVGPQSGIQTVLGDLDFASPTVGYFSSNAFFDDRLYRSADGGASWNGLGPQFPRRLLKLDFYSPQEAIAYGLGGFYRTADQGATWSLFATSAPVFDMTTVLPAPPAPLTAGSGQGIAGQPLDLAWSREFKVRSYQLQIARTPDFSRIEHEQHVAVPSATVAGAVIAAPGLYYWRVRATNLGASTGPWSDPQALRVGPRTRQR
jgi:photosystem II stability/assembly factor-like uncharacterized protein